MPAAEMQMILLFHIKEKSMRQSGLGMISVVLMLLVVSVTLTISFSLLEPQTRVGSVDETIQKMEKIRTAIVRYRTDGGSNPTNLDRLISQSGSTCSPDTNPSSSTFRQLRGWCGPYLSAEFTSGDLHKRDGWGSLFAYDGINLRSCGPNRTCGDSDDILLAL